MCCFNFMVVYSFYHNLLSTAQQRRRFDSEKNTETIQSFKRILNPSEFSGAQALHQQSNKLQLSPPVNTRPFN